MYTHLLYMLMFPDHCIHVYVKSSQWLTDMLTQNAILYFKHLFSPSLAHSIFECVLF